MAIRTVSNLVGRSIKGLAVAGLFAAFAAPAANSFDIFWSNLVPTVPPSAVLLGAIGGANLDGTGANPSFITGSVTQSLATDTTHIYWTNAIGTEFDTIGRANLDGTGVNPNFIGNKTTTAGGLAVDGSHVYWTTGSTIGRANLDGTGLNQSFITLTAGRSAGAITVEGTHIYWEDGLYIGRANLDGTGVNESFITGIDAYGLAVDATHIYWSTFGSTTNSIGRANLDGTGVTSNFISTGVVVEPPSLAVDGTHIYWTNFGIDGDTIARANLDGSDVSESFIPGLDLFPANSGIAVIPEPGTGLLVMAGVLGLAIKRRVIA
jgi:hypothetical protein